MRTDMPDTLVAYRHQLHAAIERDLARATHVGRLKRRVLALSVPATAAAATTATLLLTAGGAAGPSLASAAILRHVRSELTPPPGSILHESATVTLPNGSSSPFELWAQTGAKGVYRVIKGGQEVSLSDTKNEIYDPAANTVTVSPLPPQIHKREASHAVDIADELRRMVDSGQATATPTIHNGIPAYQLSIHTNGDTFLNGTAYVARSDYRPLEIDSTTHRGEKVVFSTYEYLPATSGNNLLLAVATANPGVKLVNQP